MYASLVLSEYNAAKECLQQWCLGQMVHIFHRHSLILKEAVQNNICECAIFVFLFETPKFVSFFYRLFLYFVLFLDSSIIEPIIECLMLTGEKCVIISLEGLFGNWLIEIQVIHHNFGISM